MPVTRENLRAWQKNIGYVPQHIFLIDETVAANIAFGMPARASTMAAVERAARIAELHEFVLRELPKGYDTLVGERGVRLSGGQRQRIGIARALYHDPDVLVIDEATSALDSLTEKALMDAIRNLGQAKTILLIAHRLSTVQGCDTILMMSAARSSPRGPMPTSSARTPSSAPWPVPRPSEPAVGERAMTSQTLPTGRLAPVRHIWHPRLSAARPLAARAVRQCPPASPLLGNLRGYRAHGSNASRTRPLAARSPPAAEVMTMRYHLAAMALRGFSSTAATRYAYRKLGNLTRDLQRDSTIPYKYFERTRLFIEALQRHGIARPGLEALEIGTGWVHWESLMLRNQVEAGVLLYDVWDNRSFRKFRAYAGKLTDPAVRVRLGLDNPAGIALMQQVAESRSAAEAYALLGFRYLVDPTGALAGVPEDSFDLVISSDVGEHIPHASLPLFAEAELRGAEARRLGLPPDRHHRPSGDLRPLGPSQAVPQVHRQHYQSILSEVQYINLAQLPEWREALRSGGLRDRRDEPHRHERSRVDRNPPSWQDIPPEDLACTVVQFILRRPAG